jgi:hypothetical protein
VLLVGGIAAGAYGQVPQDGPKKHAPVVLPTTNAPVTEAEARATFARAEMVLQKALHLTRTPPALDIPSASAPVHREQVIAEMAKVYDYVRPKITMTPAPVKYDPAVLKVSHSASDTLNRFVRLGAVARVGPLATGPSDTLTVPQFGDAIGFFLARIAELTHLPSNKWTPELTPAAGSG